MSNYREQDPYEELDEYLAPAADAISSSIIELAERLAELDLIGEDNPGARSCPRT